GEVAAGVGFRESLAPDLLGAEDLRQVALLLRGRPPRDDRRPRHAEPDHTEVRRRLRARELLEEDRVVAVRGARAAVLLRPGEARVARFAEPPAPLAVRVLEPAAAARLRPLRDVLRDERAHLGAEGGLLRRVAEIHGAILRDENRADHVAAAHRLE